MRSTPARMLHNGQLIIGRTGVSKINAVEFPLPQNTVTISVTDQMTGEQSTHNLRWDSIQTTEEPLEVKIGDIGKITVELAQVADEEDRPVYRYKITDEAAGIDQEGTDLHLGARLPADNTRAAKTLLSQLYAAGEAYETELEGGIDSDALDRFPMILNEWAYVKAEEIEMAQVELIRGLER